jgi:hypothetical protein
MNELMIIGLIGEDDFAQLLIGMPDEFFGLHKPVQEELWRQILVQVNRGMKEVSHLISFAKLWLGLYQYEATRGSDIHVY